MKISVFRPKPPTEITFQRKQSALPLSYAERGWVTRHEFPATYDHDRNEALIGRGQSIFQRAKAAIQAYDHFPGNWAFAKAEGELLEGQNVGVYFHQFGLWWWNGSRVIEVIDEPNYYGFSYGTLTNHVERGEELFYTRITENDEVYYGIHAFSKPRFWGARLFKPYARWQQARFVRDSIAKMKKLAADA